MVDWGRFELLPDWGRWWRSLVRDEKLRAVLRAFFFLFLAIGAIAIVMNIAQEWHTGTVVETIVEEVARRPFFLILIGIAAAIVALLVLLWIVGILWAWIMLPFTLQAGASRG